MKGFVMNKRGSALLLLVLILGLPGCGGGDTEKGKGKKSASTAKITNKKNRMAQSDERAEGETMSLADAELQSFFSDMDDLVAFENSEERDFAEDQFAWSQDGEQLDTVYFEFGKDRVAEDQMDKLALNAEAAKELLEKAREQDSDAQLIIEGHACSSAGSEAYNKLISQKRAQDVADSLVEGGMDRDSLRVVGRGYDMPVVKDGDRDEQWANRRVELHVVHA